jgi:putative ABC transport system substrate-binding protein
LKEAEPKVSRVAALWDPAAAAGIKAEIERPAAALKLNLVWIVVDANDDADGLVARALAERADALFIVGGAKIYGLRRRLVELAAMRRLPAVYDASAYVEAGGLLSHAPSIAVVFRECARYVDKILKGAKPGDLPIERPAKFETAVNLKAAKALGVTIPQSVLLRAERVID